MAILFTSIRKVSEHLFGVYDYNRTMKILKDIPQRESNGFKYWSILDIEEKLKNDYRTYNDGDSVLNDIGRNKTIHQNI